MNEKLFPCRILEYCPYGFLVEHFPIKGVKTTFQEVALEYIEPKESGRECPAFGHDCPVDYVVESYVFGEYEKSLLAIA